MTSQISPQVETATPWWFPCQRAKVVLNKRGGAWRYAKAGLVEKFGADWTFALRRHFEGTCQRASDVAARFEAASEPFRSDSIESRITW